MLDQCPGVIQQHLDRDTTEQQESFLHPGEPVGLAFPQRRPDMDPSRVAERGDEQMDPQSLVPDPHPRLAEVDLQLMARRRLERSEGAHVGKEWAVTVRPRGTPDHTKTTN